MIEKFLINNKDCIKEYVGNDLSFEHLKQIFGVSNKNNEKIIYLLKGKHFLDEINNFSKIISEIDYLNNYGDYTYIF